VLAAGDLDGDGRADLAVSEPGADVTVADSGAVLLFKFGASGPEPLRAPLTGLGRGNFGASLAIADVDGDGDADLVIGSPGADLAATSSIKERGVVDVFLQTPGGPLPDFGSLRVGGVDLAADGTPKASSGLRFGRAVAIADFNGDGHADLASLGAVNNSLLGGTALAKNQIAVAVYLGRAAAAMSPVRPLTTTSAPKRVTRAAPASSDTVANTFAPPESMPPWLRTMVKAVESPSPVPFPTSFVVKKGSKMRLMTSGGMPPPVSATVTRTWRPGRASRCIRA